MGVINTIIGVPLGYLMWLCYKLFSNYGVAILFFTLLTKVILFPLSIWVQKNSIKMIRLQPEVNMIFVQYMGSRDRCAEKQMELYKREGYRPMVGVVPMLIQIPIIIGLISVMYNPLQHLLHLDSTTIAALVEKAVEITGNTQLGSGAQLKVIELVQSAAYVGAFESLSATGLPIQEAIAAIQGMDLQFFGLDLSHVPTLAHFDAYLLFPLLSGLSALLLCMVQNRENVLQREQGFWGRWGMAIFLTLFSGYFAFLVPAGVGLYWIAGNVFSILTLYLLNWMYDPRKEIDYEALEESKRQLAESKKVEKALKPTAEQTARAKTDYKRFFEKDDKKDIVIFSEKNGFYKYFGDIIDQIKQRSEYIIHYVTADPRDQILSREDPRVIPYYVDEARLIPLMMKIDADIMLMTTPSLQIYQYKRSLVNKAVEYIYTPHDPVSTHMGAEDGAFDHFDTIFCVGNHQVDEIREMERVKGLPAKNLVPCGYVLMDNLLKAYADVPAHSNEKPKVLIAPSWQDGNIMDGCLDELVTALLPGGYDLTIRPHPEYVKRYPARMQAIVEKYKHLPSDDFHIETDFSSNASIFMSDLVVTDWSGIALEFSYTTKKPSLFINTPMKVLNPDYEKIPLVPIEVSLRNVIGVALEEAEANTAGEVVRTLFASGDQYKQQIVEAMDKYVFNQGHSSEVAAEYIVQAIGKKRGGEEPEPESE